MKVSFKIGLLLMLGGFIVSCSSKKQTDAMQSNGVPIINLSDNVQEVKSLPLSDVAAKVEIVPLEVTDESLLANVTDFYVSEYNIWIHHSKDPKIYRFTREGKFLNTIGKRGQGPGEYTYFMNFMIDEKRQEVYVVTTNRVVYVYDFNGAFKRQAADTYAMWLLTKRSVNREFYLFQDQLLATAALPTVRPISEDSIWTLAVLDSCFRIQKMFSNPAYKGWEEIISRQKPNNKGYFYLVEIYPSVDTYNGQMTVMFDVTDTIYGYNVSDKSLTTKYTLFSNEEKGNYEDTHRYPTLLERYDYFRFRNHLVTKNFIYLTGEKRNETYIYCYDRQTGHVRLAKGEGEIKDRIASQRRTYYYTGKYNLTNDICGGWFSLYEGDGYPIRTEGKYWVNVFEVGRKVDIEAIKSAPVKDERLREQFVKALEKMYTDEDSNPMLMIVTLK